MSRGSPVAWLTASSVAMVSLAAIVSFAKGQVAMVLGNATASFVTEQLPILTTRNPVSEIRCQFIILTGNSVSVHHSCRKDELPSREGAPGGLDRASGFPFPL